MKQYIKYETPSRAEQETVILYDQVSKHFRVRLWNRSNKTLETEFDQ